MPNGTNAITYPLQLVEVLQYFVLTEGTVAGRFLVAALSFAANTIQMTDKEVRFKISNLFIKY